MPQYLIRLDDACPQMHIANWQRVEDILNKYNIKPIVAVIPDNKDETLFYDNDENFWSEKIVKWQSKNWELALHGYQHLYTPTDLVSLVPFKQKSEFTGFDYETQKFKITTGLEILNKHHIFPAIFIAPGHAFDDTTVQVLLQETNIKFISDGISTFVFKKLNINWIPQQLWSFRKMPFGTWTICLHPNTMTQKDFEIMDKWISKNEHHIINANKILHNQFSTRSSMNILFEKLFWMILKLKK